MRRFSDTSSTNLTVMVPVSLLCCKWIVCTSIYAFPLCFLWNSVALRFRCFSTSIAVDFDTSEKMAYGASPVMLFHAFGPHIEPWFCSNPAPIHLFCHDPLWDRLITVPPSNLHRLCINASAKFVVLLPISWWDFSASLLTRSCTSWSNFGLTVSGVSPPIREASSVSWESSTVSCHSSPWSCVV